MSWAILLKASLVAVRMPGRLRASSASVLNRKSPLRISREAGISERSAATVRNLAAFGSVHPTVSIRARSRSTSSNTLLSKNSLAPNVTW